MSPRPGPGPARLPAGARRLLGRAAAPLLALALLAALDAFWLEPRRLLLRRDVAMPLGLPAPLRIVHLSDLHVARETALLRRLVAGVAEARPDFIAVSGDLLRDTPQQEPLARHTAALAALVAELRRIAPVWAVQGHSEHQGKVIADLADAGISWLSNEGVLAGPGGRVLLLGLNQQVGRDALVTAPSSPFRPVRRRGGWTYGAVRGFPYRNFYSHYDPPMDRIPPPDLPHGEGTPTRLLPQDGKRRSPGLPPGGLASAAGPLAWSGYDLVCDVLIEDEETAVGVTAHSRFVLGEDRMIRLIRDSPDSDSPRGFFLTAQGTQLAGDLETGVEPEPGRWYRLRLRTEVAPDRVRVLARVWLAGSPEPRRWQARAEDRSRHRLTAGTVGLWAAGGGTALYRGLRVVAPDRRVLLARSLAGPAGPAGFRQGARGTRLAMALARSPRVAPGTPRVVLAHTTDPVLEAAWRGLDAVLAGHTHGGQIRIPLLGPLTTRSRLGPYYDRGLFAFAAPNPRGWTWLHVEPGIGTSLAPVRFWCPPSWTVIELGPEEMRSRPVPR